MEKEEQISKTKVIVFFIVLISITIVLQVLKNSMPKDNKIINAKDYIIEKETEYSEDESKGLLPLINLKGKDAEKINNEIIGLYYGIAYKEYDIFKYEYNLNDNILSLLITITVVDNSEYGIIEYYSYNIDVEKSKSLNEEEIVTALSLSKNKINDEIEFRLKKYYSLDVLNKTTSYQEYKELIGYDKKNIKLYIKDETLYAYISLGLTPGLLQYQGNINEILITKI